MIVLPWCTFSIQKSYIVSTATLHDLNIIYFASVHHIQSTAGSPPAVGPACSIKAGIWARGRNQ